MGEIQHIAVLAFPFGTHAAPLLALARRLLASSSQTPPRFSFFSTANSNNTLTFPNPNPDHTIKHYNICDGWPEGEPFSGNVMVGAEYFLKVAPENFKKGMEEAEEESGVKISCLLTDAFLWFAGDMAEELGISWLPFWTAGSCSLSIHFYTDLIRKTLGMAKNVDKTLKFIPGMEAVHVDDLPEGILHGNLESPFARAVHNMGLNLPRATAVVLNSFEELEPTITNDLKLKLPRVLVLHIGPPTLISSPPPSNSDESGCLSWLDKHEVASVVYISFGTIMTPPPNELQELAQTLEASKFPFLWSIRDHSRHLLPQGFLDQTTEGFFGKFVSWAPQTQVLAHPSVGVFVTHCGWNSILESITGGVPMICRPFFGDQTLNSRMVNDVWRIGVRIEGGVFTQSGTTSALELVLLRKEGKKMRESIRVLKQSATEAVGPNGSSTANFQSLLEVIKTRKHA